jgi:hypothetical protein
MPSPVSTPPPSEDEDEDEDEVRDRSVALSSEDASAWPSCVVAAVVVVVAGDVVGPEDDGVPPLPPPGGVLCLSASAVGSCFSSATSRRLLSASGRGCSGPGPPRPSSPEVTGMPTTADSEVSLWCIERYSG